MSKNIKFIPNIDTYPVYPIDDEYDLPKNPFSPV